MNNKKYIVRFVLVNFVLFSMIFATNNSVYVSGDFKDSYKKSYSEIKSVKYNEDGIKIKWSKITNSAGYIIYRKEDNGGWGKYDEVKSTTKYLDKDIETGVKYQYAIKAYTYYNGKKLYGALSKNKTKIIGRPKKIGNVSAKFTGEDNVSIKWNKSIEVSGYYIYRRIDNGKWKVIATIENPERNTYKDNLTEKNIACEYKVVPFEIIEGVEYKGYSSVTPVKAYCATGIDVSYHNGKISWDKVKKDGIDFAFIRAGYGDSTKKKGGVVDSQFARNVKNARKNDIDIGVYLYSCATSVSDAKKEANFLVNLLKKYGEFEYPVVYDFESSYRKGRKYKNENTKMIKAFCNIIEEAGYDAMIYSDYNMLTEYVDYDKVSKYGVWLAYWTYNSKDYPVDLENVQIWQYSDRGRVKGISEDVDRNVRFINK